MKDLNEKKTVGKMNNLFDFDENFDVVLDPQIATLKPFKKILDKYKDKKIAVSEISYIVFLLHPKSDFADIRDEEERGKVIKETLYAGTKIKFDKVTDAAIEFYKSRMLTTKTKYLSAALTALDKTANFLKDVDYEELNDRGGMFYDPKKVIDVIKESPKLMSSIRELEEQIKKDEETQGSIRGSIDKGVYED